MPGPHYRDPWAAREAWRRHPIFSNSYMFRQMFPGFGIATVAFGLYLFYDNLITSKQPHHASEDTQGQHGIAT